MKHCKQNCRYDKSFCLVLEPEPEQLRNRSPPSNTLGYHIRYPVWYPIHCPPWPDIPLSDVFLSGYSVNGRIFNRRSKPVHPLITLCARPYSQQFDVSTHLHIQLTLNLCYLWVWGNPLLMQRQDFCTMSQFVFEFRIANISHLLGHSSASFVSA